ncbi:hypothetical protein J5N97_003856 [Dioscorea zingiberensis]|uniref:Uncharacterized protein n=1 Tax=Dioscorea zingiberensis TaxID=325984 RepID=A0A9D5HQH4_9LILI|nr:hypothetical protein J5N97_003856 [Dioscorea zingiberensis]
MSWIVVSVDSAALVTEEDATCLRLPQHQESHEATATSTENASGIEPIIASRSICEPPKHEAGYESITHGASSLETLTNSEPNAPHVKASTASATHTSINPAVQTAPRINPRKDQSIFTAKKISHSISVSENLRLLCAVTIGLLVVLQYHNYAFAGKFVSSIINFRPLILVLLTDATIVLGRVLLTKDNSNDNERTKKVETGTTNSLSIALEVGLTLQKGLMAVTMDCSICAVIMICAFVFKGTL